MKTLLKASIFFILTLLPVSSFAGGSRLFVDSEEDDIQLGNSVFDSLSQGSISAWVYTTADEIQQIFKVNSSVLYTAEFYYRISKTDASMKLHVQYIAGGSNEWVRGGTVISQNEWHNLILTSDGSTYAMYVDGDAESLTEKNLGVSNNGNWFSDVDDGTMLYFLGREPQYEFNLEGNMAHTMIFNRPLTANEAKTIGTGCLNCVADGLIAYWPLTDSGGTIVDRQGAAYNGTNNGTAVSNNAPPVFFR